MRRRRLSGRSRIIFLPFVRAAFRVEDHVCESENDCVSDGSGGGYCDDDGDDDRDSDSDWGCDCDCECTFVRKAVS